MGLDICIGAHARWKRELEPSEFSEVAEGLALLNEVLVEGGLLPHSEPLNLAEEQCFDAQMYGYSGLHTVRRLAAYWELKKRAPTPEERLVDPSTDPVLEELYQAQTKFSANPPRQGLLDKLFNRQVLKPGFQHLLWHSDCMGFYVPQGFADVVFDQAEPQRPGLGSMVGSSIELLNECRALAQVIELPNDIDPEADEVWQAAEESIAGGPRWRTFGIEAFCLSRLLRACELSLQHKAVILFA